MIGKYFCSPGSLIPFNPKKKKTGELHDINGPSIRKPYPKA
jgi:hypothetical protein